MLTVSELWSPFSECVVSSNRRGVLGELWLGVLCAGAETVFGWVAVCSAGWQAGTQVAVQTARHAEMAAAAKPEEEAVVSGRNIPPGCPVPHTSASSFCSETTFSPYVWDDYRELMLKWIHVWTENQCQNTAWLLYQEHLQYDKYNLSVTRFLLD